MSDHPNVQTAPGQQAPAQYPPHNAQYPPQNAHQPVVAAVRPPDETTWVRCVYLFGACATGGILMIVGLLLVIGSTVAAVSPDSALRDGWDRGLVGTTEIVDAGLDLFDQFSQTQLEDDFDRLCDGETDDSFCDDLSERIDEGASTVPDELTDNIGLIRDEVHRQIRVGALAELAGGLALTIVGLLLFRFHSKRVSVYASV